MNGLDIFRTYFKDYQNQYVLIGGAACDVIFEAQGTTFRSTKDLDIVLIVEALTPEFGKQLWKFVKDGGYTNKEKSNGDPQFYRFQNPEDQRFPHMIELFSRQPDCLAGEPVGICTPIPLGDEISSLSAILLNEEYYHLLLQGCTTQNEFAVLSPLCLIPFKAKAWLDLTERRAQEESIDTANINKHKKDVVRLATLLRADERCSLPAMIRRDMELFLAQLALDPIDPKVLRLKGLRSDDILKILRSVYLGDK